MGSEQPSVCRGQERRRAAMNRSAFASPGGRAFYWALLVSTLVLGAGCAALREEVSGKSWSQTVEQENNPQPGGAANPGPW